MANLVDDVAYQVLDAIGIPITMGDIEDGSDQARVLLRSYRQCLMQLLRAVHWNFARKQTTLVLLADATGNTAEVGTQVPAPWLYEYALPIDCAKVRFVPWNPAINPGAPSGNIVPANPNLPLMPGVGQQPWVGGRLRPARFLEATDFNYPVQPGNISWETQGVSPQGRTVILTNVKQATLVYTAIMLYPSVWDSQFRAALVAYIASEVALPLWVQKDKTNGVKVGMQLRQQQIAIAKEKITQARVTDGNEGVPAVQLHPDWMTTRHIGGPYANGWGAGPNGGGDGDGIFWNRWDNVGLADGTSF
jgi:hypothetical protein